MSDWRGKTVFIAGGSGGMGRAIAARFVAAGAKVYLADINRGSLDEAVRQLGADSVSAVETDVTRVADCAGAIDAAVGATGRLDLLVNAAGIWTEGPSDAATETEWDRVLDVNLKGTFFMCRYAIPHLEKTGGTIINISSDAGVIGSKGAAIYCASKGGVNLLTKSLGRELAARGIRVNAICPCDVDTPMIEYQANTFGHGDPEAYKRALLKIYPQGARARFATPAEIAAFVYFVASPEAAPITGACLSIDFGTTAGI
ncbi:MAG TPA: SDR family NAD(P)-dependent oxidoreductase [Candidatus Acidoferrum sp.]|nr:SDR family NAD(P)-dependent oxidoreductase [Candidatus Acidoferrum sp.]